MTQKRRKFTAEFKARVVMFPPGKWKGDDGSIIAGSAKKEIDVHLKRLPWFRKIAD